MSPKRKFTVICLGAMEVNAVAFYHLWSEKAVATRFNKQPPLLCPYTIIK